MKILQNTRRVTNKGSSMPAILAGVVTFMFACYMASLYVFEIPNANKDILNPMGNTLSNVWIMVMTYYYGTNLNSKNKDAVIAQSVPVQRREDDFTD